MIHIVTPENRHVYAEELREHHRLRREIYIEERKWQGLRAVDGLEYDDFDTDDTVYVLAIENGRVVGASRLFPTTKPHMLSTVCPQLAEMRGIPTGPDVWEWTRLFAVKDRREGRYGGGVIGRIFSGGLEFCLNEGITALSIVFEAWWLPRFHEMGWTVKPLGLPGLINDEWWLAALIPVNERTLAATRRFHRIDAPVLVYDGAPRARLGRVA